MRSLNTKFYISDFLLACFRPFRNRSKYAINTASLSSVSRISEWCWICTFKAYVFKIKQRILQNLSTLMHQFFQFRNIQRGSLSTIGVKGLIVRQLYTQSYLYNIRVFFRVETSTRRDAKDSLRRCWYNNLAKSFLTHPLNYLHLNAKNWKLTSSSLVKYFFIRLWELWLLRHRNKS